MDDKKGAEEVDKEGAELGGHVELAGDVLDVHAVLHEVEGQLGSVLPRHGSLKEAVGDEEWRHAEENGETEGDVDGDSTLRGDDLFDLEREDNAEASLKCDERRDPPGHPHKDTVGNSFKINRKTICDLSKTLNLTYRAVRN